MAFVSDKQQKRLAEMVRLGTMSQETYDKMESGTMTKKPEPFTKQLEKNKTVNELRAISKKKLRK